MGFDLSPLFIGHQTISAIDLEYGKAVVLPEVRALMGKKKQKYRRWNVFFCCWYLSLSLFHFNIIKILSERRINRRRLYKIWISPSLFSECIVRSVFAVHPSNGISLRETPSLP